MIKRRQCRLHPGDRARTRHDAIRAGASSAAKAAVLALCRGSLSVTAVMTAEKSKRPERTPDAEPRQAAAEHPRCPELGRSSPWPAAKVALASRRSRSTWPWASRSQSAWRSGLLDADIYGPSHAAACLGIGGPPPIRRTARSYKPMRRLRRANACRSVSWSTRKPR